MAAYSFYPEHGKSLTSIMGGKEGDAVCLTYGSYAYSKPRGGFGYPSCQFTNYILPAPVGFDQWGTPLFDIDGIGTCPLDGSPQNETTRDAADKRESARLYQRAAA